jgi:hypothetical protein
MIYGWDISTSIVGMCVFTDDGQFLRQGHLDLRKLDNLVEKADAFKQWITDLEFVNGGATNFHFIEERLGGFSGGRTSAQVLMKLAQFNAVCSYILWTYINERTTANHRQIAYLHPSTWKSIMKKEGLLIPKGSKEKKAITLDFVRRKEPEFKVEFNRNDKPQPWCFDEADAWCLGRSGWRKLCIANENFPPSGEP